MVVSACLGDAEDLEGFDFNWLVVDFKRTFVRLQKENVDLVFDILNLESWKL